MKYMGIDYHKQYFVATTMDERGRVLKSAHDKDDKD